MAISGAGRGVSAIDCAFAGFGFLVHGSLRLQGLTLRNCVGVFGGGVAVSGPRASLDLVDVAFEDCAAATAGGGVAVTGGASVTARGIAMTDCAALAGGGIAATSGASVVAVDASLERCVALSGGAVYAMAASIELSASSPLDVDWEAQALGEAATCLLASNEAVDDGGAVEATPGSRVSLTDCALRDNSARADGGAVVAKDTELLLRRVVLLRNDAGGDGGAVLLGKSGSERAVAQLDAVSFVDNSAGGSAGCLGVMRGVSATVERAAFVRCNAVEDAGALDCEGCDLGVSDSVFLECGAAREGGAVKFHGGEGLFEGVEFLRNSCDGDTTAAGGALYMDNDAHVVARDVAFEENAVGRPSVVAAARAAAARGDAVTALGQHVRLECSSGVLCGGGVFVAASSFVGERIVASNNAAAGDVGFGLGAGGAFGLGDGGSVELVDTRVSGCVTTAVGCTAAVSGGARFVMTSGALYPDAAEAPRGSIFGLSTDAVLHLGPTVTGPAVSDAFATIPVSVAPVSDVMGGGAFDRSVEFYPGESIAVDVVVVDKYGNPSPLVGSLPHFDVVVDSSKELPNVGGEDEEAEVDEEDEEDEVDGGQAAAGDGVGPLEVAVLVDTESRVVPATTAEDGAAVPAGAVRVVATVASVQHATARMTIGGTVDGFALEPLELALQSTPCPSDLEFAKLNLKKVRVMPGAAFDDAVGSCKDESESDAAASAVVLWSVAGAGALAFAGAVAAAVARVRVLRRLTAERAAGKRIEALFHAVSDPLLAVDKTNNVIAVNSAASRLFGDAEDLIGEPLPRLIPDSRLFRALDAHDWPGSECRTPETASPTGSSPEKSGTSGGGGGGCGMRSPADTDGSGDSDGSLASATVLNGVLHSGTSFPLSLSVRRCEVDGATLKVLTLRDLRHDRQQQKALENLKREAVANAVRRKAAERANKLKHEWLAFLFHEVRVPLNVLFLALEAAVDTAGTLPAGPTADVSVASAGAALKDVLGEMQHSANSMRLLLNDVLTLASLESGKFEFSRANFNLGQVVADTVTRFARTAAKKGVDLQPASVPGSARGIEVVGDAQRIEQCISNYLSNALKFTPEGGRISVRVEVLATSRTKCRMRVCVRDTGVGVKPEEQGRLFQAYSQIRAGELQGGGGTGLGLSLVRQFIEKGHSGRVGIVSPLPGLDHGSEFFFEAPFPLAGMLVDGEKRGHTPPSALLASSMSFVEDAGNSRTQLEVATGGCGSSTDMSDFSPISSATRTPASNGLLSVGSASGGAGDVVSPMSATGRRVLVVDDSAVTRKLMTLALHALGAEVCEAENGQEALDLLLPVGNAQAADIGLILMDREMPLVDGESATKRLVAAGVRTPIVGVTANALPAQLAAFRKAGAWNVVTKPVTRRELGRLLQRSGMSGGGASV